MSRRRRRAPSRPAGVTAGAAGGAARIPRAGAAAAPARPPWWERLPGFLALWAAAAGVRLLFLAAHTDRVYPFSVFYYGDSRAYREYALALLNGRLYDSGIPFHPPLFAWVLAAVIEVVGERPTLMRAVLAVVAALAVPLTQRLGRRLFGAATGWVAAGLATFSFGLLVAAVSPNVETVYLPLLVGQVLAAVALGDALAAARAIPSAAGRHPLLLTAVSGLLLGLGSLARAEHLAFFALLPVALLLAVWPAGRWARRRALAAATLALAVGVAVVAPWSLHAGRSLAAYGRAHPELAEPLPTRVLVTGYGALNFALANHPAAGGGFDPRPVVGERGGALDLADPRHLDLYLHGYRHGLGWIAESPGRWLRLAAAKLAITGEALRLGFGAADRPSGLAGVRRPVDLFSPRWSGGGRLLVALVLALAVAGAWRGRRSWRRGGLAWLAVVHKLAVAVAFFGYVRLGVHLLPLVFLVAAHGLTGGVDRLERRRRFGGSRPAWWAAVLAVALAAALTLELGAAALSPQGYRVTGSADARGLIVQDALLRITPR